PLQLGKQLLDVIEGLVGKHEYDLPVGVIAAKHQIEWWVVFYLHTQHQDSGILPLRSTSLMGDYQAAGALTPAQLASQLVLLPGTISECLYGYPFCSMCCLSFSTT